MSYFNGYDMADFDAYEAGYSHGAKRRRRNFPYFGYSSTKQARNAHINTNIRRGIWFTGEKISDMTDRHLANALALCKRKKYEQYVKALTEEIERRKAVER